MNDGRLDDAMRFQLFSSGPSDGRVGHRQINKKMLIVYHHQMKQHDFFCKTDHCQCALNYIYIIVKLDRTIIHILGTVNT